jgi:hypothetical protein
MPLDSNYRPLLHPRVTPPRGNQEPPAYSFPLLKRALPLPLFFRNGTIEELNSSLVVSPPRHRLPSLHHPIKGVGSLTICCLIHFPPYFGFLLHKNSLSPELKLPPPPPLLAAWLHLSLHRPELWPVRSSKSPSSSSIHCELPCITAVVR